VLLATLAPKATHVTLIWVEGDKRGHRDPDTGERTLIAPLSTVTRPDMSVTVESEALVMRT